MTEQFEMKRQQYVTFTKEEAEVMDQGRKIASRFSPKPVSVNKFISQNTVARADEILAKEMQK
ncbi:hypothetical protein [Providencia manganoxydans]|uniref:hypothetical protein n=1 Tax=Providencia manganoxydans TaxID=2923283 RepID=UPI0032DB3946